MSLVWTWCAKEWRAQRAFLLGYAGLAVATVGGVATLVRWRGGGDLDTDSTRAIVVLGFVVAVSAGSLFAAAATVRGELVGAHDRLWQRLPGALAPAFAGKLLFLALVAMSLAVVGLFGGQLWLWMSGLEVVDPSSVVFELERLTPLPGLVAAPLPAVFTVALWMPGARMAVGATTVLAVGLVFAVTSWLRVSPGLSHTLTAPWLAPWSFVVFAASAFVACVCGRRGGGSARSAQLGAAVVVLGALPPALWFGSWLHAYWRPDLHRLGSVEWRGWTADGRYVVVEGSAHPRWPEVAARFDLQTGEAVQIGWPGEHLTNWWGDGSPLALRALLGEGVCGLHGRTGLRVVDLRTLESLPLAWDRARGARAIPAPLAARMQHLRRTCSPLRQPGDLPAWIEEDELCLAQADGTVVREPMPEQARLVGTVRAVGHGFERHTTDRQHTYYDLTRRRWVELPAAELGRVAVRGIWLLRPKVNPRERGEHPSWRRFDPATSVATPIAALAGDTHFVGLLDDDQALFGVRDRGTMRLVAYHVARDATTEVEATSGSGTGAVRYLHASSSNAGPYGQRDPQGRMVVQVLRQFRVGRTGSRIVAIEPQTCVVEVLLETDGPTDVLAFEPSGGILCGEENSAVRYAPDGTRTVVFPSPRPP